MIDFARSHFTWDHLPHEPDPEYKYPGGFVGQPGDAYHVRIGYDAVCTISGEQGAPPLEIFLLQPCLAEYTIADRNLFQVPSQEFRVALSRTHGIPIARRPSTEREPTAVDAARRPLCRHGFHDPRSSRRAGRRVTPAKSCARCVAGRRLNARTAHYEKTLGLTVTLEYPIRAINIERAKGAFQVDTGPMALPDLATWDGAAVSRVFLAHAAFSAWDRAEFILRREVEPLETEQWWWEVRGRDRRALRDPSRTPTEPPLPRRPPTLYNETLDVTVHNEILIAPEG